MDLSPYRHVSPMREDLAFRNDLSNSIAIFFSRPHSHEATKRFFEFLTDATEHLPEESADIPTLDRPTAVHAYEIPPAVGTWSEFAVLLWENGKPVIENLSMIGGAAQAIRWLIKSANTWTTSHQERTNKEPQDKNASADQTSEPQGYFLSQAAITVLIVADLVGRFGYQADLSIATYPRGYAGYNDPGHPNGVISYLIEVRFAGTLLVYVVDSKARVTEHFQVTGSKLVPLSVPDLVSNEEFLWGHESGNNGLEIHVQEQTGNRPE